MPAPPARCGRSVRSDRNRAVEVSGMKQPHRKDWQKMCGERGAEWEKGRHRKAVSRALRGLARSLDCRRTWDIKGNY